MPLYLYQCQHGCVVDRYVPLAQFDAAQSCVVHGETMERLITAPLMVKVAQDVCYDSPIDGRPITSWAAREEDLKRHNCQPYDPEMKTDYRRRQKESDEALEKSVGETVEEAIEKMPTKKRAQLHSELVEQGLSAECVRGTPGL